MNGFKKSFVKSFLTAALTLAVSTTTVCSTSVFVNAKEASGTNLDYTVNGSVNNLSFDKTPVGRHGRLHVGKCSNYAAPTILDEKGKAVQLRGASTHGIQWFPQYVNKEAFQSLRDEWGINTVRLAVYPREGGYLDGSGAQMDRTIKQGVAAASQLGMYVIIDWHVLNYNPNETIDGAKSFFTKYASLYKDYNNVIFEIANEPTGTDWYNGSSNDLYTYSKTISNVIRNCGSKAIIICGTNTWSQDVDAVAAKPLSTAGIDNCMYTLHYYAATHYDNLKSKLKTALSAGTPVFVSEFGICDASGNGGVDIQNANSWMSLLTQNNIGFCCWSLCNKGEQASYIKTSTPKTSKWTKDELTTTGIWLVNTCRALSAKEDANQSSTGKDDSSSKDKDKSKDSGASKTNPPSTNDKPSGSSKDKSEGKNGSKNKGSVTAVATSGGDWGTGATVSFTVSNNGSASSKWTVSFDAEGEISNIWCAKIVSHKDNHYVVTGMDYNGTLAAGQSTTFGYNITKTSNQSGNASNVKVTCN